MSEIDSLSADERELAPGAPAPTTSGAMKAVLTDERFSDPSWIYERKLDGIRLHRDPRRRQRDAPVPQRPSSRTTATPSSSRRSRTSGAISSPSTARWSRSTGRRRASPSSRSRGQQYVPVFYYVFDILWLEGHDVRKLPLRTRKRLLRDALQFHGNVRWTQHRNRDGEAFFKEACRKGWEGLIAKRADSPYVATRSRDWLKFKCEHGQELVIGGFTEPRGSRVEFGALLLGYYDDGGLRVRRQGRHRVRHRDAARARRAAAQN